MALVKTKDVEDVQRFPGVTSKPLLNPDRGAGAVTMLELTMQPGGVLPPHTHLIEECFFVTEGQGLALRNGEEIPIDAGTAILAETGVKHGFKNSSDKIMKIVAMYPGVNPVGFFDEKK